MALHSPSIQSTSPILAYDKESVLLSSYSEQEFGLPAFTKEDPGSTIVKLLARKLRIRSSAWKTIGANLLPSYIRTSLIGNTIPNKPRKIRSTSYMDGLRGIASFFVFIHHYPLDYFPTLHNGWLANPTDTVFLQWPFVRIIYSGRFMVGLFFVLSGYVLAHRPLQLIREGNSAALLDNLSSSVFRRAMRLFFPVILSTYIVMIMVHNGWYWSLFRGVKVLPIAPLGEQTTQWLAELVAFINPFTWMPFGPNFSSQLWTLPVEFRGSMLIFISLLGLAKAKTAVRMSLITIFALYSFYTVAFRDMGLFFTGIVLAELKQIQNSSSINWDYQFRDARSERLFKSFKKGFWIFLFVLSWYLACWPDYASDVSPGYVFLSSITPKRYGSAHGRTHFWTALAAIMMLLSLENHTPLQKPFTTSVAQYFGDISFALYIVHIPICYSVGRMMTLGAMDFVGMRVAGFMLAAVMVFPMVLWTADVYWRLVDAKCVELAKWIWVQCSVPK